MTPPPLAAERTALSWLRTSLAAMGNAALFVNHAVTNGWRATAAAPVAAAVLSLVVAGVGFTRNRSLRRGNWSRNTWAVVLTTTVVVLVATVAAVIGFTDPDR